MYTVVPVLGCGVAAVAALIVVYAVVWRKSLGTAAVFLDQASAVLADTRLLLHIPGLTLLPLVTVIAYAGIVAIYASAFASDRDRGEPEAGWRAVYRGACLLHLAIAAWSTLVIILVVRCLVSVHVCAWYWAREPRGPKLVDVTLWWSLKRVFRYHLGSLLLLAVLMPVLYPARLLRRFLCLLLATSPSSTSWLLACRPGAVCQIALHGVSLRKAAFGAHQLKRRNADIVGQCLGVSWGALAAGCVGSVGFGN